MFKTKTYTKRNGEVVKETAYIPLSNLESKALYLEQTMERMQSHSDALFRKIKRLERKKDSSKELLNELREKLKEVNTGIREVYQKCNTIWKDVEEANRVTPSGTQLNKKGTHK